MGSSKTDTPDVDDVDATEEAHAADLEVTGDETTDAQDAEPVEGAVEEVTEADAHEAEAVSYEDEHEAVEAQPYEEEYEDVRSASLASRILTWLILLIAGGGLALWGAPKVAPNLPQWAAPAAKFLTPGTLSAEKAIEDVRTETAAFKESTQSDLDALRAEFETRLAEMSNTDELKGLIAEEVDAARTGFEADVTALKDQMAAIDGTEIETRLAQLETRFEGVSAEVSSINSALQDAISTGGSVSEEALAQITSKSAEIEGLRAELGQLSALIGGVSQRIDDVEAAADRRVAEAAAQAEAVAKQAETLAKNTAFQNALSDLQVAASAGRSFEEELAAIGEFGLAEIDAVLAETAPTGVATQKALQTELDDLSYDAIRASIKADADDGTMSRVGAFFQSQLATRSTEAVEGDGTDAVLSRMNGAVAAGDLEVVLTEAQSLREEARAPLENWLSKVELRKNVLDAIAALETQPS